MTNIVPNITNQASRHVALNAPSNNDNAKSGFKTMLGHGDNYEVCRLTLPARCNLPLHIDHHASRHITILSGIIHVTLVDNVMVLVADESIYIPQGMLHGLENRANEVGLIITVDYTA